MKNKERVGFGGVKFLHRLYLKGPFFSEYGLIYGSILISLLSPVGPFVSIKNFEIT